MWVFEIRSAVAIALVIACAGCVPTSAVMQRSPVAKIDSAKTVAAVVGCYAPRVLAAGWSASKVVPSGRGQMVVVDGSAWGDPIAVVDVQPANAGSTVSVRRGAVTDRVFDPLTQMLRSCT